MAQLDGNKCSTVTFIYGLFNNAAIISDYIVLNGRMIIE
jgi:hypothetical protein